jgi:hypothetical protein
MQAIVICVLVAILLFAAAFVTRRRFGLLGLALAAGSILSTIWGYTAGLVVSAAGLPYNSVSIAITLSMIVLLPAILLLFHGDTYKNSFSRFIGAGLFMLLALAFLITPLSTILSLHGYSATVYAWLVNNRTIIIGLGLLVAIVDLFLTKPVSLGHDSKSKR